MAVIQSASDEKVFRALKWLGLNESPDGDTKLSLGEAAVMRNFRVTRDGNLTKRPGLDMVIGLGAYSLELGSDETAKTDEAACSTLIMHPAASASGSGFVALSGNPETVTQDNWSDYVGYYWEQDKYHFWKLVSLSFDEDTNIYTWTMQRVRAKLVRTSLFPDDSVKALWAGNVAGDEYVMAVFRGVLYRLYKSGVGWNKQYIGVVDAKSRRSTDHVCMFGYSNKLYILGYQSYMEWDGTMLQAVQGYVPLVSVGIAGTSGGTLLEQVNKLSARRRVWISPDGTATVFALPEKSILNVTYVKDRTTGESLVADTDYTVDTAAGTVTFITPSPPVAAVNSYEIEYLVDSSGQSTRDVVENMAFCELYNGANDNRVFLYGDGTNRAIYSGLDYNGDPRADYFPDMNELIIGEANTPITGMIRHYSRMLVFKTHSTYSIQYSVDTLADGTTVPAFYVSPVNREIGNEAPGQVQLVMNAPITLHGSDAFEWRNTAAYSSNITIDERQARRISDRVYSTLRRFDFKDCVCFDNNERQEYLVAFDGNVLVYNYAVDAWYLYTGLPARCLCTFHGDTYIGDDSGAVHRLDDAVRSDNGEIIDCYWESGSLSFDREFMRKYSALLWVGIKPEGKGQVFVTVETDRKSLYAQKVVATSLSSFASADFRHWSFNTNRMPHEKRLKIKAKKFVYYKLIFKLAAPDMAVTILNADVRVRFNGYTK